MIKNESDIVSLSLKDFFSSDILKIAILPFIVTMFVVYSLFFAGASVVINNFEHIQIEQTTTTSGGDFVQQDDTMINSIANFFLKSAAISWIVNILVYSFGIVSMLYVSIFISLIVIGFLTPYILNKIRNKHYLHLQLEGNITIVGSIWYLIKTILTMFVLFIALIPFYFIPLVNIFAINLPFYYLFHKLLNFDVGTTILDTNDLKEFKNKHNKKLRLRTLKLYLLSLIPFMSLILPVYYVVYLGHGYFATLENDRNN